jgi:cadmium resistance protein CadD (predicted permease)
VRPVHHGLATAATAAGLFAGTNVDDLVVVAILFAATATAGRPSWRQICAGQYLGAALLVAVSSLAALGLRPVSRELVGLLGVVPIALGLRALLPILRARGGLGVDSPSAPSAVPTTVTAIVGVTLANGADNVTVYTAVLRSADAAATVITVVVFALLVAGWCVIGWRLGSHWAVVDLVDRHGHWLVPLVFIAIGLTIVVASGVVGHAFRVV